MRTLRQAFSIKEAFEGIGLDLPASNDRTEAERLSLRAPQLSRLASLETARGDSLSFLSDFYEHYELSQPQRRVRFRFAKALEGIPSGQMAQFTVAEVSEHRSRRNSNKNLKKTEQLY